MATIRPATALAPGVRSSLREVLRPPTGFRFERALGTAFSLDARTLVAIPLFASGLDSTDGIKPIGIQRIFEVGQRLTLLVQGDRIKVGDRVRTEVLTLVEDAVVPCAVPRASFHPKLLVLEYIGPEGQAHRRVVLSSRNLTVDDSWDFVVVLDEDSATGRQLPGLGPAVDGLATYITGNQTAREECRRVAHMLEGLLFEPVPLLDDMRIDLLTQGSDISEVMERLSGTELLVISPFVTAPLLQQLAETAGSGLHQRWLVTRPAGLPEEVFTQFQVYRLRDDLLATAEAASVDDDPLPEESLRGLHAKVYLTSGGHEPRVVLTSANATTAGWSANVEIALSARITARGFSIKALMTPTYDEDDGPNFGMLLEPVGPTAALEGDERDPDWVRDVRNAAAATEWHGVINHGPDGAHLRLVGSLSARAAQWPPGTTVCAAPHGYPALEQPAVVTLKDTRRIEATLDLPKGTQLTRFLSVRITRGGHDVSLVVMMDVTGERDWTAVDAREVLILESKPELLRDLAYELGVALHASNRDSDSAHAPAVSATAPASMANPAFLEPLLLRLAGPDGSFDTATIDGLISTVVDEPEFASLVATWNTIKGLWT